MLIVKRINSNEIIVISIFFLLSTNPNTLIKNKTVVALRKFNIFKTSILLNLGALGFEPRTYGLKAQCSTS